MARYKSGMKAGRGCYSSPKDFRPISLSSFILKTVERLIDRYMRDSLLTKHPLHKTQHAYWVGRSTEITLHTAVSLIETQLEAKGFAIGTFMDIEGAFNHTSRGVIRAALVKYGVPRTLAD